jgi:hypothetical protein
MKFRLAVFTLFSALLTLAACEEPNINTSRLDPAIRATFIDTDSIINMEASIAEINSEISLINDRLDVIDSLIDAGDPTDYTEEIDSLELAEEELFSERTEVNTQLNEVSKGNILIEQVTATRADEDIFFDESRSVYRLPLDPANSVTEYFILYNGRINTATFNYTTDTVLTNRTVKIIARDLSLPTFDYDSANLDVTH